jgi:hypothetical protein
MITIRPADKLDIPILQKVLAEKFPKWEQVDLHQSITWIAEKDGVPFGSISLRAVWQIEPLIMFNPKVKGYERKKGSVLLYKAVEKFLEERAPTWSFLHAFYRKTWQWMERLGWHRCYSGGRMYCKDFPKQEQ